MEDQNRQHEMKSNVIENMIDNNELKQFREIIKNRNGSAVAHSGMTASFKYGYNTRFLPHSREVLRKLNICLIRGINITEEPCMTNPRIPSSPTDFSLLMPLQTSA
jgi:hypothetical protein